MPRCINARSRSEPRVRTFSVRPVRQSALDGCTREIWRLQYKIPSNSGGGVHLASRALDQCDSDRGGAGGAVGSGTLAGADPPHNDIDHVAKLSFDGLHDPGQATLRRLNRAEYANAIRDLLALDVDVAHELPQDNSGYGSDNVADVLSVSPTLMDRYVAVAGKVGRLATGPASTRPFVTSYEVPKDGSVRNSGRPACNERASADAARWRRKPSCSSATCCAPTAACSIFSTPNRSRCGSRSACANPIPPAVRKERWQPANAPPGKSELVARGRLEAARILGQDDRAAEQFGEVGE